MRALRHASTRPWRRTEFLRTVSLLGGLALLVIAVVSAVHAARQSARTDLDAALAVEATSQAGELAEYFDRARSLNLLLAQDSAFRRFEPGPDAPQDDEAVELGGEAAAALAYLERLYPGRISEACLIDASGTELARVVEEEVAPAAELSTEEASAPFFAPTMALSADRVHQAAPYRSPDTDVMVISNSTPLVTAAGRAWGLVHFEVALDSFRPVSEDARRSGIRSAIVDLPSGEVVLTDGRGASPFGTADPVAVRELVRTAVRGSSQLDDLPAAVAVLPRDPDNVNEWAVVTVATSHANPWQAVLRPATVTMAVAAVLLLGLAGVHLRLSQRQVRRASLSDELTGLPNRRLLGERIAQQLLHARRRGTTLAVLLIDLDRFKEVNDTLGHGYGDVLLKQVADRLRATVRDVDTVARLGGDEFAVLLSDVDGREGALTLARRCLDALQGPFVVDGVRLAVEASLGIALAPHHGRDEQALLRAADVAMYAAKETRGGAVLYDQDLDVNTPTRLALLADLRRALQEGELYLTYQPKVDVAADEVRGVEALVRWAHPTRGLVTPAEFVPVAEGTGLIVPLTVRTLELAIAQARRWLDEQRPLQIAVNLSPRCLLESGFAGTVAEILSRHGVPSGLIRLEITESTIMSDPARALDVLLALRELGVSLSIDDFGTGYSSMAYLKRLPVDELKIDRSFVLEMLQNSGDQVLVRSSIDLGHNLGLAVVAEGVEDEATLSALTGLGCDVVQGFHLARPMSADQVGSWLDGRGRRATPGAPPAPRAATAEVTG
ncbi:putative bifunctional diguanylate cyclase/phosphodiesterase [Aquipuribacter nitratireducens]|uniref:Bifunctional diguanylate cyclase/phosphodiesterase n=1 Tax=Aquipuribacter nitratireducens TaxID=650104 RepID=A0ABW0GHF3_9MICO